MPYSKQTGLWEIFNDIIAKHQYDDSGKKHYDLLYGFDYMASFYEKTKPQVCAGILASIKGIAFVIAACKKDIKNPEMSFYKKVTTINHVLDRIYEYASNTMSISTQTREKTRDEFRSFLKQTKLRFYFYDETDFKTLFLSDSDGYSVLNDEFIECQKFSDRYKNKYLQEKPSEQKLTAKAREILQECEKKIVEDGIKLKNSVNSGFIEVDSGVYRDEHNTPVLVKPFLIDNEVYIQSINYSDAVVLCNKLSYVYGFTPCYTSYSSELKVITPVFDLWDKNDNTTIYCDYSADGFRLPAPAEYDYAKQNGIIEPASSEWIWESARQKNYPLRLCRTAVNNQTDKTQEYEAMVQKDKCAEQAEKKAALVEQRMANAVLRDQKQAEYDDLLNRTREKALSLYDEEQKKAQTIQTNGISFSKIIGAESVFGNRQKPEVKSVESFYMSTVPITNRMFISMMGNQKNLPEDDVPVTKKRLMEAYAFCNALSLRLKLEPYYVIVHTKDYLECTDPTQWDGIFKSKKVWRLKYNQKSDGFRLPTEYEWMYAARSGIYMETYKYSGSNDLMEAGWSYNDAISKPQVVAKKKPNRLGLYDMTGNVWEMCEGGICKGGSYRKSQEGMSLNSCFKYTERDAKDDVGFRVVCRKIVVMDDIEKKLADMLVTLE